MELEYICATENSPEYVKENSKSLTGLSCHTSKTHICQSLLEHHL